MRKRIFPVFLCSILIIGMLPLASCSEKPMLNPENPITVSLWHNYGGQMKDTMDALVNEFNSTIGSERGVIVSVTSVSSSSSIVKMLEMAANGEPGAPVLPDVTTLYPITALLLKEKGLIANLNDYFSNAELSAYIPAFLKEGYIDDTLYVFPVAKSTEVLFLNRTLFDKFSAATGITIESLSTFEGVAKASQSYYAWTDSLTPDVAYDGKAFYMPDSWFNLAQIGMEQLKTSLIEDEQLRLSSDSYKRVFETLYLPSVEGGIAIADSYSSEFMKTGDIVCSTGSTAGVLFYGDSITYSDNTVENVVFDVLPYPLFEGGEKVALQRGGGMCIFKSDAMREYASSIFIKWFTQAKQNERFVESTGYLPVTQDAFLSVVNAGAKSENANVSKLLMTASGMLEEYRFYLPPVFEGFNEMDDDYTTGWKSSVLNARDEYKALLAGLSADAAYKAVSESALIEFAKSRR